MPCSIVLHFDSTETRLRSRPPHVCMSAPLRCTHSTGSLRLTEPPQPHTAAAGYAEPLTPEQQHQAFLSRLLLMLGSFVIMVRVCLWGGGGGRWPCGRCAAGRGGGQGFAEVAVGILPGLACIPLLPPARFPVTRCLFIPSLTRPIRRPSGCSASCSSNVLSPTPKAGDGLIMMPSDIHSLPGTPKHNFPSDECPSRNPCMACRTAKNNACPDTSPYLPATSNPPSIFCCSDTPLHHNRRSLSTQRSQASFEFLLSCLHASTTLYPLLC